MAFRLKFSSRALHEMGEAQVWYDERGPGLGEEFISAVELRLKSGTTNGAWALAKNSFLPSNCGSSVLNKPLCYTPR
jgi:hypothetical protein